MKNKVLKWIFFVAFCSASTLAQAEWVKFKVPEEPNEGYYYDNKRIIRNQKNVLVWVKRNLQHSGGWDGMTYKSVLTRFLIDCSIYSYDVTSISHYSEKDLTGSMKRSNFDGKKLTDIPIDSPVEVIAGIVCKKQ
jgi:hypothetical protein